MVFWNRSRWVYGILHRLIRTDTTMILAKKRLPGDHSHYSPIFLPTMNHSFFPKNPCVFP